MLSRLLPPVMMNPTGSAASCGMRKLLTIRSPILNSWPLWNTFHVMVLFILWLSASRVKALAKTGIDRWRNNTSTPCAWSLCSWVIKIASSCSGDTPSAFMRRTSCLALKPASTRIWVEPQRTSAALPLLPLPRTAILMPLWPMDRKLAWGISFGKIVVIQILKFMGRRTISNARLDLVK